eukprot:TRINITY_DN3790_c0_g2_i1.p1 TRINITY_DN3790_c0_g2~~TRINITY_DN3790_c0_g2_i1.p1  ORF type:complete len:878 (+),score=355.08 TRINITY_DN3790_c0_g2_i1:43-2634(+)
MPPLMDLADLSQTCPTSPGWGLSGSDPDSGLPYVDRAKLEALPPALEVMFRAPSQPGLAAVLWCGRCDAVGHRAVPPRPGWVVVGTAALYISDADGGVERQIALKDLTGVVVDDENWLGLQCASHGDELLKVSVGWSGCTTDSLVSTLTALTSCSGIALNVSRVRAAETNVKTLLRFRSRPADVHVVPLRVTGTAPPPDDALPTAAVVPAHRLSLAHLTVLLQEGASWPPIRPSDPPLDEEDDLESVPFRTPAVSVAATPVGLRTARDTPLGTPRDRVMDRMRPPPLPQDPSLATAKGSTPKADLGAPQPLLPLAPAAVRVSSVEKPEVQGTYILVGLAAWRGLPVWAATDDRRLYATADGHWILGAVDVMEHDAGWLMSAVSSQGGAIGPTDVTWAAYNSATEVWDPALGTAVTDAAADGGPIGVGGDVHARLRAAAAEQAELRRRLDELGAGDAVGPQSTARVQAARAQVADLRRRLDEAAAQQATLDEERGRVAAALGTDEIDPLAPAAAAAAERLAAAVAAADCGEGDDSDAHATALAARLRDVQERHHAARVACEQLTARLAAARELRSDSDHRHQEVERELGTIVQRVTALSQEREAALQALSRQRSQQSDEQAAQQRAYEEDAERLTAELAVVEQRIRSNEPKIAAARECGRRLEETARHSARQGAAIARTSDELAEVEAAVHELESETSSLRVRRGEEAAARQRREEAQRAQQHEEDLRAGSIAEGVREACEQLSVAIARIDELEPAAMEARALRAELQERDRDVESLRAELLAADEKLRALQRGYENRIEQKQRQLADADRQLDALRAQVEGAQRSADAEVSRLRDEERRIVAEATAAVAPLDAAVGLPELHMP